jgi:hypothetical protein
MKKLIFILAMLIISTVTSCKKFPDLGNGYQLNYNSMNDISIIKCLKEGDAPTVFIYGHILDYAFDSTFIIVAERPRDSVPGVQTMTQPKYQKAFEQSTFHQYWIIDKTKESVFDEITKTYSNVYGPYKEDAYLATKKILGIPNGLKISTE